MDASYPKGHSKPLPPILGTQGAPTTLQHSLDLGWGNTHGMTVNPQGGVGNSCQVPFPITNPHLRRSWGERGPQAGTTLRSWHKDMRAAKGLEGAGAHAAQGGGSEPWTFRL